MKLFINFRIGYVKVNPNEKHANITPAILLTAWQYVFACLF